MIKLIKKLFHKHNYSYIGRYYSVKLADNLESYDFTLYKVWHCKCNQYKRVKICVNNVDFMKVNEMYAKYDCQGLKQIEKLGVDFIEVS